MEPTLTVCDPGEFEGLITFHAKGTPILVIDREGMTYKGQRIEDAGEAHRAFLSTMNEMQEVKHQGE